MNLKYEIVKNELLKLLEEEKYRKGAKLPTEYELMESHGYSRNTVRQALSELESEGVIFRVHGKGTFFRDPDKEEAKNISEAKANGFIGLVNFYYLDYIYPDIMRGIEDTIYKKGYSLVMANCNQDLSKEVESVNRLIEQGVKGLILEPSRNEQIDKDHPLMQHLNKVDIPVVTTHWNPFNKKFSMVTINDRKAGKEAVDYLFKMGHRKIAIIYKKDVQSGKLRFEGYLDGLKEHQLPVKKEHIKSYCDQEELGISNPAYDLTLELFVDNPDPPSAIFYFNDYMAAFGYDALKSLGKKIPEDVSVLGFDDVESSASMDPPLTTFEHPKYILGRWAAYIILEELDVSHRKMPMQLIFEPVFVERKSVRKI